MTAVSGQDGGRLRRAARRALVLGGLSTIGIALALGLGAPDPGAAERSYASALGLIAWSVAVTWLGEISRRQGARGAKRAAELGITAQERRLDSSDAASSDPAVLVLVDLERNLRLGRLTIGDYQALLRPRLADLAATRLARLGMPITSPAARSALGDSYALVDPARAQPVDRGAPGVSLDAVAELVSRLEELT